MKRLGKKFISVKETIESYCTCGCVCNCSCACYCSCNCYGLESLYTGVLHDPWSSTHDSINYNDENNEFGSYLFAWNMTWHTGC